MNYLTQLPDELIIKIMMNLQCIDILILQKVLKRINKIDNILGQRKLLGFPRPENYCKTLSYSFTELDLKCDNGKLIKFENLCHKSESLILLKKILIYDYDLVKGDVIIINHYNDLTFIFDGYQMFYIKGYLSEYIYPLSVPINYWKSSLNGKLIKFTYGNEIKNEMINNIDYTNVVCFTSCFTLNSIKHNVNIKFKSLNNLLRLQLKVNLFKNYINSNCLVVFMISSNSLILNI